jgi:hypothetical protein
MALLTIVDGAVGLNVVINGKNVCTSKAIYAVDEAVKLEGGSWTTIKEMSACLTPIKVNKGDGVIIEADYDFDLHPRYSFWTY